MLPSATRPKCHTANSVLLFDFLTLTKQHMNHAKAHIFPITIYPFSFFLNLCHKNSTLFTPTSMQNNSHTPQFVFSTNSQNITKYQQKQTNTISNFLFWGNRKQSTKLKAKGSENTLYLDHRVRKIHQRLRKEKRQGWKKKRENENKEKEKEREE